MSGSISAVYIAHIWIDLYSLKLSDVDWLHLSLVITLVMEKLT